MLKIELDPVYAYVLCESACRMQCGSAVAFFTEMNNHVAGLVVFIAWQNRAT